MCVARAIAPNVLHLTLNDDQWTLRTHPDIHSLEHDLFFTVVVVDHLDLHRFSGIQMNIPLWKGN